MGDDIMNNMLDPGELVSLKELLMFQVIQSEALMNLFNRKGIVSKEEVLEEMKKVHASMVKTEQ